jgi:hypothetical protein
MRESNVREFGSEKSMVRIAAVFLSLVLLAAWMWILNWASVRYAGTSYLRLCLHNGAMISAATAFFALVWKGLDARKSLLSLHPLTYLAGCMFVAGVFFLAIAANLGEGISGSVKRRTATPASVAGALWDGVFAIVMDAFMGLVVIAWILTTAPGFYVLTLFTGAPARRELQAAGRRLTAKALGSVTTLIEQPSSSPAPNGTVDVSFGADPFALTNALNAAIMFLANVLIARAA